MIFADTVHLALRNIREAVLRTVLTSLGIAIGIASLVGMVSFGVALQDQIVGNFLKSGVFDSITIMPATPPLTRNLRGRGMARKGMFNAEKSQESGNGAPTVPRASLDDESLKKIAALDRVKEVYPDIRVSVEIKYDQVSEVTGATGVPMSARGEGVFQNISFGQFFPNDNEDLCMISLDFAHRLTEGEPKDLIGKDLSMGWASAANPAPQINPLNPLAGINIRRTEKKFKIIGIIERQPGPGGMGMFSAVMIPMAKAKQMQAYDVSSPQAFLRQLSAKSTYNVATVKVKQPQDTEEVEKKIKEMGFNAFSVADAMRGQRRAFMLLDILLALVGSIALTVASLGIVNTMVMSILERTREIGIMKAIGGSDEDVRRIFLLEAALMGLMGGLIGDALGWAVGRVINFGANYYMQNQGVPAANLFSIPWWLSTGGIVFALVVSLIAGSFPAMRAARLDPILALRHD
jgi:ABC-type antimicrobial peptide transport system permease subunit